jgi:hypothetical protein
MTINTSTSIVEGVVEGANDNGIKVKGEWLNRSQFNALELPAKGSYVRAQVDARGYLKSIETVAAGTNSRTSERDRTITRLAVLKAAADFMGHLGSAREQVKADHVLAVADRWLEWVEREP